MKEKVKVNNLFLNITTRCNMDCKRCYGHLDNHAKEDMDLETAKKATELYFNNQNEEFIRPFILFFGGEPMMNWELVENYIPWINSRFYNRKYDIDFFTNGLTLNTKKIDFLMSNGVNIYFSLDGDYSVYSKTRPIKEEKYEHIISMIRYCVKKNPDLVIPYCVLKKEDIPKIGDITNFIGSLGVKCMTISKDFFEDWSEEERTFVLKNVKDFKSRTGMELLISPERESECIGCTPQTMMVYPNGDVYDLCHLFTSVLYSKKIFNKNDLKLTYFGNLKDIEGLYLDINKKKMAIQSNIFCPTLDRDYSKIENLAD